MEKHLRNVLIAIFLFAVILFVFSFGNSPGSPGADDDSSMQKSPVGDDSSPESGSVPCDEAADISLRDDCFRKEAVVGNDSIGCDKVKDMSIREDCYREVSENIGDGGGAGGGGAEGGKQKGGGQQGGSGGGQNVTPFFGIELTSAYHCGSDICLQMKAMGNNTGDLEISSVRYYINGLEVQVSGWDGGVYGNSCPSTEFLEPLQSCFGKILGASCIPGDIMRAALREGAFSVRELSECV